MSGFVIKTICAFVAVDPIDGDEGIIGELMGDQWMPFVMADEERIAVMRPRALNIARTLGVEVKLVKFSLREELETL